MSSAIVVDDHLLRRPTLTEVEFWPSGLLGSNDFLEQNLDDGEGVDL